MFSAFQIVSEDLVTRFFYSHDHVVVSTFLEVLGSKIGPEISEAHLTEGRFLYSGSDCAPGSHGSRAQMPIV